VIAIRRLAERLFWPSVAATAAAAIAAVILFAVGDSAVAGIVLGVVALVGIPFLAFGYASPRPGLAWEGRYAEPWRAERSSGESSSIEAARLDREMRRKKG
jgi:hypothetical protein